MNVELERKWNNEKNSTVASLKVDAKFKQLNNLKWEGKLNCGGSA